jgi:hypothetical protein
MLERIAVASAALVEARAEVAASLKRQAMILKMAEKKEAAIASFTEKWSKEQMARIDKAMKPKKSRKK